MYWSELAWIIPILPLIAFVLIGFLGNKLFKRIENGAYLAIAMAATSCFLSLMVAYEILSGSIPGSFYETHLSWLVVDGFTFNMGIYIDTLTALMLIVVSFVATLVVIYSIGYMHEEGEKKRRYYAVISLFIGVMLGLVLASNYLQMFIFWELVGLCSYLLIGFWNTKPSAASAAKKAFLVTRIGDIMFMLGLFILFVGFNGNLDFDYLFTHAFNGDNALFSLGTFFIFGGAIGKSAQFPLHDWLPDAMEGPTTVSALIHAATMVKAGVYLVARSFPIMVQTPDTMLIIAIIGGFTALFTATMALNNPNIKRVLAYSTISQLGYMFLALGTGGFLLSLDIANGGYTAGMFHLMNHAFFKALLFLSAGAVIHAVHTEDMRLMGGLSKKLRLTSMVMLFGCLSIAGFPFLSGFFSKDEILAVVFEAGGENPLFYLLYIMALVTAFLTAFYMFRLWFMTFRGEPRDHHAYEHAHEAPKSMAGPLIILGVLALFSGLAAILLGFENIIIPHEIGAIEFETILPIDTLVETFTHWLTYLSIAAGLGGIFVAYMFYERKAWNSDMFVATPARRKVYDILLARYGFTAGYDLIGLKVVYGFSRLVDWFDRKVVDGIVNLFATVAVKTGNVLRRGQTGFVQSYALLIVLGVSLIAILLFFFGGVF